MERAVLPGEVVTARAPSTTSCSSDPSFSALPTPVAPNGSKASQVVDDDMIRTGPR